MAVSVFVQFLINIIVPGSLWALAALGLSIVTDVNKIINLAYGTYILVAGYTYLIVTLRTHSIVIGFVCALAVTIILGLLIHEVLYERFHRERKYSDKGALIASVGVLFAIQNILLILFGSQTRSFLSASRHLHTIAGASISTVEFIIIATCGTIFILSWLIIHRTRYGLALQAVADHSRQAELLGLSPQLIRRWTTIGSLIIAAIVGILFVLEYSLEPSLNIAIVLRAFGRSVLGGIGSVEGALVGSFLTETAENLGAWYWSSAYKDVISFVLVFIILLVRPQGLFGKNNKQRA